MIDECISQKGAIYKLPEIINKYGSKKVFVVADVNTYKAAGENIAGNSSNTGAVNAWMNSEGHRANILSNNYNYTGVAVVKSPVYGKVYVQMFMGK